MIMGRNIFYRNLATLTISYFWFEVILVLISINFLNVLVLEMVKWLYFSARPGP